MINIQQLMDYLLTFADDKNIDERDQWFRIEGSTRSAGNHDRRSFIAVDATNGNPTHLQDVRNVEVIHLKGHGKTDQRKFVDRSLVFHCH